MSPFRRRPRVRATLFLAVLALLARPAGGAEVSGPLLDALGLARPTERLAAPGFVLPGLDGRSVSLSELRGRGVLLYFWATW